MLKWRTGPFISKNVNYIVTRSFSGHRKFFSEQWFCNEVYLMLRITRGNELILSKQTPAIFNVIKYRFSLTFLFSYNQNSLHLIFKTKHTNPAHHDLLRKMILKYEKHPPFKVEKVVLVKKNVSIDFFFFLHIIRWECPR